MNMISHFLPGRQGDTASGRWIGSAEDRAFLAAGIVLLFAMLLGGAGAYYPALQMTVELVTILAGLAIFFTAPAKLALRRDAWLAYAVAAVVLLVPAIQLVPLPPSVWAGLPGRETAAEIARLSGNAAVWRPISFFPDQTLRSLLLMLPAVLTLVLVANLGPRQRLNLALILCAAAVLGLMLGALQGVSNGGFAFQGRQGGDEVQIKGFFVNRNHQATFLLVVILLVGGMLRAGVFGRRRGTMIAWLLAGALSAGVVATGSRTGLVLLSIALLFLVFATARFQLNWRLLATIGGLAAVAIAAVMLSDVANATLMRFANLDEARLRYWSDTMWAIGHYFPWGAGIGTFISTFQPAEQLETLDYMIVNNAHNDYLEIAMEAGIPGAIGMLMFFGFFVLSGIRIMRGSFGDQRPLAVAAFLGITVILLHSMVDYPLRMIAVSTTLAFLCALLIPARQRVVDSRGHGGPDRLSPGASHV